jgi:hypothetical protein
MTRPITAALLTYALLLGACQPKAAPQQASASAAPPPPAPPPQAFTVGTLADSDYSGIQGCTTVFGPVGAKPGSDIFVEDAGDTDGKGLMKIDGKMVGLKLVSQTQSEKGGLRQFKSADGKLSVAENFVTGKAHEESDSVEMTGTLTITWNGSSQSIKVEGGTAC